MELIGISSRSDLPIIRFDKTSRIGIVGVAGSGKSTLAKLLAAKYELEHVELDSLFINANWVESDFDDFRKKVSNRLEKLDGYIVDGNYKNISDLTWEKCTTIIWLNYKRRLIIKRVFFRTLKRVFTKEVLWNGNIETFKKAFMSKESILLWSWNTYNRRKNEFNKLIDQYSKRDIRFIVINNPNLIRKVFSF